MRYPFNLNFWVFVLLIVLSGCAASKQNNKQNNQQNNQLNTDAKNALVNGDYEKALTSYENIIAQNKTNSVETPGSVYNDAGIAAWGLQQTDKSVEYLETAKRMASSTDDTYAILSKVYKNIDNLSKEISNLEEYAKQYPQGKEIVPIRSQLFSAYVRSENWESGENLWPLLDSASHNNIQSLTGYLKIKSKLGKDKDRDIIARQLIKMDKNNIDALEILAKKHYQRAEDIYIREMNAYEKNKTMSQYNQLTEALKRTGQDYKTAREYFERLYKLNPNPNYAIYLGNIYTRFKNKEKADYYYRLAKKKN